MLLQNTLEQSAILRGSKTALICKDEVITYAKLDSNANSLANALVYYGVKRQDRVLIYLPNSIEVVVSLFAAMKANGIFVIINPQVKASKLCYIINDCIPAIIITDRQGAETITSSGSVAKLPKIIILDKSRSSSPGAKQMNNLVDFHELLEEFPPSQPVESCIDIDLASLVYTSGSTGEPKGVMLTHINMLTAARSIIQYLGNDEHDVIIDVLPLSFDYGLYQVLMSVLFGGTVVIEKTFTYPSQILDTVKKYHVTGFPLVPAIASLLLTLKNLNGEDFPDLRYVTNTGQTLPPIHIKRLRQIFPKVKIFSMYGLTECKRVAYLPPEQIDKRPTSVGKAIPNTEVYIVDDKGITIDVPRKSGQLVVRGSHVMSGYWNLPEKTADCLRPGKYPGERVLFTGDIFEVDEEGFLYFLGRRDDMFKSGGQFVSPKEVENVLHSYTGIMEAAVLGIEDSILGQAVVAFVVKDAQSEISAEDISYYCLSHLERHMIPKIIKFRESLPKSLNGKIDKPALKNSLE